MTIAIVAAIQINDEDGPAFKGFYSSIDEAKEALAAEQFGPELHMWSRDVNRLVSAWYGHDRFYLVELPA